MSEGQSSTQRVRRSQTERHAETRRNIIQSVVTCIDQLGFHEATMQRVALEAGVTVGAIQHHFSSKADLLSAVLKDGFRRLSFSLHNMEFQHLSLQERVSLYCDYCWAHCNSAEYQTTLHILLGMRNEIPDFEQWLQGNVDHFVRGSRQLWQRIFADVPASEEQHFNIQLFVFSVLSGTALLVRINQQPSRSEQDLALLKRLLLLHFAELQQCG